MMFSLFNAFSKSGAIIINHKFNEILRFKK